MNFLRYNQKTIRAELYQGIADAVANGQGLDRIGTRTILPSSFTGGPRQMRGLYQDSMAIVRYFTKPDLFITVTCNPKWPEIVDNLLPGQRAQDRPDIVSRVFNLKLKDILKDLTQNGIFGRVISHMYVIEFQKRGLPHAHILIILVAEDKPRSPEDINTIVSAELPDPELFPELFETIVACMLHGPCGLQNTKSVCMKEGRCSKGYPKPFAEATTMPSDQYPIYKRSENGRTAERGGHIFDNRDVVPYNPYLCAKYDCHINVEIANGILAVKYLHKYVYKGHDRTCIAVTNENNEGQDEIQEYLDARYVSACEASWRIFQFSLHHQYPAVQRLQLHLPDEQYVVYDVDAQTGQELVDNVKIRQTTLTEFFVACKRYPELAADMLYPDFPSKFTWNCTLKKWSPRKNASATIGRVFFAVPSDKERFYLRMLLYTIRGPTSYINLRTYEGCVYPTYQETCIARGLLETDEEWDICLTEAATIQTGFQFRQLFVTLLLGNSPSDPRALFDKHLDSLSDDCRYRLRQVYNIPHPSDEQILSFTLQMIQGLLQKAGKDLTDFSLPHPIVTIDNLSDVPRLVAEELNYDIQSLSLFWEENYPKANAQQKAILDDITRVLNGEAGGLFYIDGPGGTGKTFVENLLLAYVRSRQKIALAVASSGIASILLEGGRTSHSRFKIPLDIDHDSVCDIKAQSSLAELLRRTCLIIWDEAPAQHRHCFEAVDRTLRDLRSNDSPFGGVTVVFAGISLSTRITTNSIQEISDNVYQLFHEHQEHKLQALLSQMLPSGTKWLS